MGVDELLGPGFDREEADRRDPVDQLRRRERQQALVAELGRSALTGTPLERLVEDAVDAAAEGLSADRVGLLPRLFGGVALAAGIGLSGLALATRRWGLVWASALSCTYCVLDGIWAIWSRQTAHGAPGPGIGLVLAVLAIAVLAMQWLKLALSRR